MNRTHHHKKYNWTVIQSAYDAGLTYKGLEETFGVVKRTLQKAKERGDFAPRVQVRLDPAEAKRRKKARDRESWVRYMAKRKYQTPADEDPALLREFYANCPEGYEVDHVIPLSRGGAHSISNVQYLTPEENKKKGNKLDGE